MNQITNKHLNKTALILGHGPSLDLIKKDLDLYKKNGIVLFGCNQWFSIYNTSPHYWVMASNDDTILHYKNIVKNYDGFIFYADSVDLSDKNLVNQITTNYLTYDQRHFDGKRCDVCNWYHCDKFLNSKRLTIQEELQKYTKFETHYSPGSSVALHMLAFAIMMGYNPIYFTGLDLDYHKGYANNNAGLINKVNINEFDIYRNEILQDLFIINESAKKIGIKLINLNHNSSFDFIEIGNI